MSETSRIQGRGGLGELKTYEGGGDGGRERERKGRRDVHQKYSLKRGEGGGAEGERAEGRKGEESEEGRGRERKEREKGCEGRAV